MEAAFSHYKPFSSFSPQNSIIRGGRYHVFLCFRGPDVRKTLVDHLYQALSAAGLRVFLDSEKIAKGKNIEFSLKEAINDSTIHIPIFSPGYADSPWCLNELLFMQSCKSVIIPLFYNLEPHDVRYPDTEKSPYAGALKKHSQNKRHSKEEIEEWKKALHQVSNLSGWSLSRSASGYEARLTKQIVMDLLQTFNSKSLDFADYPVGLTAPTEDLFKLLKMDSSHRRQTIGIHGMGGVGKTTLSKAIYNKTHHMFTASCFVSQVRATVKESVMGIRNLQRQIIKDLIGVDVELNSVDQGKKQMKNYLASVRALVILDDVEDRKQFDALAGDWYGAGSRIIITTRDEEVLNRREVDDKYPMKVLDYHQGVELFCRHAFLASSPQKGYENMTKRIVKACAGLPLSLEIVGAHLYSERDLEIWRESLTKLSDIDFTDLYQCLKISYNGLSNQEKIIFLDIACSPIHFRRPDKQNKEFYVKYWKCLGCKTVNTSLKKLERKSLIVVDESYPYFRMHKHMRDLGRQIVQEESRRKTAQPNAVDPSVKRPSLLAEIISVANRMKRLFFPADIGFEDLYIFLYGLHGFLRCSIAAKLKQSFYLC